MASNAARRGDKTFAQPRRLRFVVLESSSEIPPDAPAENNRQRHAATARVRDHFVDGNDVVRIALVLREALIEDSAVGVAQRNRRCVARKTFPEDFKEPQTFFSRQLEDFSNVRVAHGAKRTTGSIPCSTTGV